MAFPNAASPLSSTARRLLAARFWRSIAQGALVVDLSLYLSALDWSGAAIGAVLSAAGIVGALFGLAVGFASDRVGRKPFLLAYEGLSCVCGLAAFCTSRPAPLAAAIILAGFGRGANGAAGPFAPAEQAWLAETVEPAVRGSVFSLNSALGFVGMAVGAVAAMLPALWKTSYGAAGSYRPIFLIVIAGNFVNLCILLRASARTGPPPAEAPANPAHERRRHENRFLWRLMGVNSLNGLSVGLTGPLISYWFAERFQIGFIVIAPVMAATFVAAALSSWFSAGLAQKSGSLNVVVWGRSAGLVLLLIFPVMPFYALAAALHILRSALNRGTIGARQALVLNAVPDERRGLAASLNSVSARLPQAIGPAVAGGLIGSGWFVTPFYLAAVFQAGYLFFYNRLFRATGNDDAA
ncbi:MAG: MFS transporter [Opitutaceae bacterium]